MSKTAKELIKDILAQWEFPVMVEDEHNLAFRYEMSIVNAYQYSEELNIVTLILSGVFRCESDEEKIIAVKTCNDINCSAVLAKIYIDSDDNLVFCSDFCYESHEEIAFLLNNHLSALIRSKKSFIKKYLENEAELKLMSELQAACKEENEEE